MFLYFRDIVFSHSQTHNDKKINYPFRLNNDDSERMQCSPES